MARLKHTRQSIYALLVNSSSALIWQRCIKALFTTSKLFTVTFAKEKCAGSHAAF